MTESVLGVKTRPQGTFGAGSEFKDAGLVDTPAAATVDATAQVIDVGTGLYAGKMIIDVSALEIADTDEIYDIVVQGSTVAAFATDASIVELAQLSLSAKEVKRTDSNKDDSTGRYKIYFDNENDGTYYRYLRVYTVVDGTMTDGINYTAYAVKL